MITVIPPVPSTTDDYFWQGVRESRLVARRCVKCGLLQHPPAPMCPQCQSLEFDVEDLSGSGVIHSWILSRHPSARESDSRVIALIDLTEGIRMVGNVVAEPDIEVRTGMAVHVTFERFGDVTLPQFIINDEAD